MAKKHSGLGGRGIHALLGGKQKADNQVNDWKVEKLPLAHIQQGSYQPRQKFDEASLVELAESIKSQGLVQPIIVKWVASECYELIAGERRWRAAKLAGLETLPAIVREVDDQQNLAMAVIENIQRENLGPLEEAQAFARLIKDFDLNQQSVADIVGRSRVAISNTLRLLKLPELIQDWLQDEMLTMGHARALLSLPEHQQLSLAKKAIDQAWSVRQMEEAVKRQAQPEESTHQSKAVDPNVQALQAQLSEQLGAKVKIAQGAKGRGRLEISYTDLDELDGILKKLLPNR
ncbi:ParB/RepB/Spo0J family partition protein [Thiomicrospira microaerophila]|uniref:ParB/RepB/Spo0J family partition protein n=1 Tax=Thiomicrospira microaerophila TaxID=406020 RepID=UPI00200D0F19|nr:ParB/RepB/Spo0J family partition protein [Thiomicrospira microaerophila]UQB42162.1 ParB/RepB/Spo0J family partition protein [Thiomicrospira microaerophila]